MHSHTFVSSQSSVNYDVRLDSAGQVSIKGNALNIIQPQPFYQFKDTLVFCQLQVNKLMTSQTTALNASIRQQILMGITFKGMELLGFTKWRGRHVKEKSEYLPCQEFPHFPKVHYMKRWWISFHCPLALGMAGSKRAKTSWIFSFFWEKSLKQPQSIT